MVLVSNGQVLVSVSVSDDVVSVSVSDYVVSVSVSVSDDEAETPSLVFVNVT